MKTACGKTGQRRHTSLVDQQHALGTYLGSLLQEGSCARETSESQVQQENVVGVLPMPKAAIARRVMPRFQAQLFSVAGITLAVPVSSLAGVVSLKETLGPVPGQSPLFIGTIVFRGVESRVVDTARFVLPEDRAAALDPVPGDRASCVLVIDEGRWALACKRIGDVVEFDNADINWRSPGSKRPWLAGTVSDRACALLDVEQLAALLVEQMA